MEDWGSLAEALKRSEELLRNTWALDGESVAEGISAIHNETAVLLKYNNENSGYADVAYLPRRDTDQPALAVEQKWNKSARGAIAQIKDRQYAAWIATIQGTSCWWESGMTGRERSIPVSLKHGRKSRHVEGGGVQDGAGGFHGTEGRLAFPHRGAS